jgi:hypothetical protein
MAGFDSICVVFKNGQLVKELTKRYDVELELSNGVKLHLYKGRVSVIGLKEQYSQCIKNYGGELLMRYYLTSIAGKRKVSRFNYFHCVMNGDNKPNSVAWERGKSPITFDLEGLSFKVEGVFAGKTKREYPTKRHCNDYKTACKRFHPNEKPFYLDDHHPIALKAHNRKGVRVSYFYEIYTVADVNGDVYTFFTTMNYDQRKNCIFDVVAKRFNTTKLELFKHIDDDSEVDGLNSFFGDVFQKLTKEAQADETT